MTVQELQDRITKKEAQIAKLEKKLSGYHPSDEFKALCDKYFEEPDYKKRDFSELKNYEKINNLWSLPEYYSVRYDVEDAKLTLAKYQKQLKAAIDKEKSLADLPQVLVDFKNDLIDRWNEYDRWKKAQMKKDYSKLNHADWHTTSKTMSEKWGRGWYDYYHYTSLEYLYEQNKKDAEALIIDMLDRVTKYTGKITDVTGLDLERDNQGYAVINGTVYGEDGKARVESIYASGPIQRLHVRVLVKSVK